MSSSSSRKPFTNVIDLTTRAQEASRRERSVNSLAEPDPPLPSVTLGDLPETIQRAVGQAGWTSLLPVQQKAIPYLLDQRDMIVQSRTGSGKTGAFLLPLLRLRSPGLFHSSVLVPEFVP